MFSSSHCFTKDESVQVFSSRVTIIFWILVHSGFFFLNSLMDFNKIIGFYFIWLFVIIRLELTLLAIFYILNWKWILICFLKSVFTLSLFYLFVVLIYWIVNLISQWDGCIFLLSYYFFLF